MARITVEDCLDNVSSRFDLVMLASIRVRQLQKGAKPCIESDNRDAKGIRDRMLSVYVEDVMGRKLARMLSVGAGSEGESKPSFFHRRPGARR